MNLDKEVESLKLYIQADKAIMQAAFLKAPQKGPVGFMIRHWPLGVEGAFTMSISYGIHRLFYGDSPEEIAQRSQSLIQTFSKPSNP